MMTSPVVGEEKPAMRFNSVDFPDPELPTINTNSPFFMENDTSVNALILVSPSP